MLMGVTRTETFSDSLTMSLTSTKSWSLPTDSNSKSDSRSVSRTSSESLSLHSITSSLSIPTVSQSISLSKSKSISSTKSLSVSTSESKISFTNITSEFSTTEFTEGQEIRISITAVINSLPVRLWNTSDIGVIELALYSYSSNLDQDCSRYPDASRLMHFNHFGLATSETFEKNEFATTAHFTFSVPSHNVNFIVCYKIKLDSQIYNEPVSNRRKWQLLFTSEGNYIFKGQQSTTWYYLPETTSSQYAIIQILSNDKYNFTYPPSECKSDDYYCAQGDNLKIVPEGTSCTYEFQNLGSQYIGSNNTLEDGTWTPDGYEGFYLGGTAGGIGLFGTQHSNPLTDSWYSSGTYSPAGDNLPNIERDAYVYVKLPGGQNSVGQKYDICYSNKLQRSEWRRHWLSNTTIDQIPMWKKIPLCSDRTNCVSSSSSSSSFSFKIISEDVEWMAFDLQPDSYGEIAFFDKKLRLSSYPSTDTSNYWSPKGGDYFRLIRKSKSDESKTIKTIGIQSIYKGSRPNEGCWTTEYDYSNNNTVGGFNEDESPYAIGSHSLKSFLGMNNATNIESTNANIYISDESISWYVCYRIACANPPVNSNCTANSGFRMLSWISDVNQSSMSQFYKHLPGIQFRSELTPTILQPKYWGRDIGIKYPSPATWYMNDSRVATYGPIVVEISNTTDVSSEWKLLSSAPWNQINRNNINKSLSSYDSGSLVKLVPIHRPCSYSNSNLEIRELGAINLDGGTYDCQDSNLGLDSSNTKISCRGNLLNDDSVTSVSFYITIPKGDWRVCYRQGAFNYKTLQASPTGTNIIYHNHDPITMKQRGQYISGNWYLSAWEDHTLSLLMSEYRPNAEALILIKDRSSELMSSSPGECLEQNPYYCQYPGDILNIVWSTSTCNNRTAIAVSMPVFVNSYCQVDGSGSLQQSGLYHDSSSSSHAIACSQSELAMQLCSGSSCNSEKTSTEMTLLNKYIQITPSYYDDISKAQKGETISGLPSIASSITIPLPEYNRTAVICYKQSGTPNWVRLSLQMLITPENEVTVVVDNRFKTLKGYQVFTGMTLGGYLISANGDTLITTMSKLITTTGDCLQPPVDLNEPFGAMSNISGFEFGIPIPQVVGVYQICIKSIEDMSWFRVSNLSVKSHQIVWQVNHNDSIPTNGAAISLQLINLNGWFHEDDRAAVVRTTALCSSDKPLENELSISSTNAGRASVVIQLPHVAEDASVEYRVCLYSNTYRTGTYLKDSALWLEIPHSNTSLAPKGQFRTQKALVKNWSLSSILQQITNLKNESDLNVSQAETAVAGGLTTYVGGTEADGFIMEGYGDNSFVSDSNQFKIVQYKIPPENSFPGDSKWTDSVDDWTSVHSNCRSHGVVSTDTKCEPYFGTCPSLVALSPVIHMPEPGAYLVCFRQNSSSAWVQIPNKLTNNFLLFTYPSFLSFDVSKLLTNVTIIDSHVTNWCKTDLSTGVSCLIDGHQFDLLTVVNETQNCPIPSSSPTDFTGIDDWHVLTPSATSTAVLHSAKPFILPPVYTSASGRYKICVFKAAAGTYSKRGVVHQLYNKGNTKEGGDTRYWRDYVAATPTQLKISGTFEENSNSTTGKNANRFSLYNSTTELQYSDIPDTDITEDGIMSRSTVVETGSVIMFSVSLVSESGVSLPPEDMSVEVVRCQKTASWAGLSCNEYSTATEPGDFIVKSLESSCYDEEGEYKRPTNGLKEDWGSSLEYRTILLQYQSSCPDNLFGCGIKIIVTIPSRRLTLSSQSFWVNMKSKYPTSITVIMDDDSEELVCYHGSICNFQIIPHYRGVPEFSPAGSLSVIRSANDSNSVPDAVIQLNQHQNKTWPIGGKYTVTFKPILASAVNNATFKFYVQNSGTFITTTSEYILIIKRLQPRELEVVHIEPLDVLSDRVSQPVKPWVKNDQNTYLEVLIPYRIIFKASTSTGKLIQNSNGFPLAFTATLNDGEPRGDVLSVIWLSNGKPSPENYANPPLNEDDSLKLSNARAIPLGGDLWGIDFRLSANRDYVNGCLLIFDCGVVELTIQTSVRVPANTLVVGKHSGDYTIEKTADISTGIAISVYPATVTDTGEVLLDRFHNGDIFVMIYSDESLSTSSGLSNSRGVHLVQSEGYVGCAFSNSQSDYCKVKSYPVTTQNGFTSASMILNVNKPCSNCLFTFHSTAGIGPTGQTGDSLRGSLKLSFVDKKLVNFGIDCKASHQTIVFDPSRASNKLKSSSFSITVQAVLRQSNTSIITSQLSWPKWWIFIEVEEVKTTPTTQNQPTVGINLVESDVVESSPIITSRLDGGNHSFNLRFSALYEKILPMSKAGIFELKTITVHAMTQHGKYSCDSMVELSIYEGGGTFNSEGYIQVTPITSGIDFNDSNHQNPYITTTISGMAEGIELKLSVLVDNKIDFTYRNITISGSATAQCCLEKMTETGNWEAPVFEVNSKYQSSSSYSYGLVKLKADLPSLDDVSPGVAGSGLLKLTYADIDPSTQGPLNNGIVYICAKHKTRPIGIYTDSLRCAIVTLTIVPDVNPKIEFHDQSKSLTRRVVRIGTGCGSTETNGIFTVTGYLVYNYLNVYYYADAHLKYNISLTSTSGSSIIMGLDQPLNNRWLPLIRMGPLYSNQLLSTTISMKLVPIISDGLLSEVTIGLGTFYWNDVGYDEQYLTDSSLKLTIEDYVIHDVECFNNLEFKNPNKGLRFVPWPENGYLSNKRNFDTVEDVPFQYSGFDSIISGVPFPVQVHITNASFDIQNPNFPRFWGLGGMYVRVNSKYNTGCNNGGQLKVYTLKKTSFSNLKTFTAETIEGKLSSLSPAIGPEQNLVKMIDGVVVFFAVFSEPCESCFLVVTLCYMTADIENGAQDCTDVDIRSHRFDYLIPETRKVQSRNFRVKLVDDVEDLKVLISNQTIPLVSSEVESLHDPAMIEKNKNIIRIGSTFTLTLKLFVKQQLRSSVMEIQTSSLPGRLSIIAKSVSSDKRLLLKYGNGGFLKFGSSLSCEVSQSDLMFSRNDVFQWPEVKFYFTRPCAQCVVQLRYEHNDRITYTILRNKVSDTNVMEFRIVSCPIGWILGGVPPTAVYRRVPFSLTVIRSDKNNFPSYESGGQSQLPILLPQSFGNGGGGSLYVLSQHKQISSLFGIATAVIAFNRACFKCSISYAGKQIDLTVLTTIQQIIMIPVGKTLQMANISRTTQLGVFYFNVYAADDLGDRAYSIGGPSYRSMQPLSQIHRSKSVVATLQSVRLPPLSIVNPISNKSTAGVLVEGGSYPVITAGTFILNGIPYPTYDNTIPGQMKISVSDIRSNYPIIVRLQNYPNIPVTLLGRKGNPILIDLTVPASHITVSDHPIEGFVGEIFTLEILLVGSRNQQNWFISTEPMKSPVTFSTLKCNYEGCDLSVPGSAFVRKGKAKFNIIFKAAPHNLKCQCDLVFRSPSDMIAPERNESNVTVHVSYSILEKSSWSWSSQPTHKIANQTTDIELVVVNTKSEPINGRGDNLNWTTSQIIIDGSAMIPPNCFICSTTYSNPNSCGVRVINTDLVKVSGYFPLFGECHIPSASLLPTSMVNLYTSALSELYIISVDIMHFNISKSVCAVHSNNECGDDFISERRALTPEGEPSFLVGETIYIKLQTYVNTSTKADGDMGTVFNAVAKRKPCVSCHVQVWNISKVTSTAGIAMIAIRNINTTSDWTCPTCPHIPWMITIFAETPFVNNTVLQMPPVVVPTPLYFIKSPAALKVSIKIKNKWIPIHTGMYWLYGLPVIYKIVVVDSLNQIISSGDEGSNALVTMVPAAIPCLSIDLDSVSVRQSCYSGIPSGGCQYESDSFSHCGGSSWFFDGISSSASQQFRLVSGEYITSNATYRGPPEAYFSFGCPFVYGTEEGTVEGSFLMQSINRILVFSPCESHLNYMLYVFE